MSSREGGKDGSASRRKCGHVGTNERGRAQEREREKGDTNACLMLGGSLDCSLSRPGAGSFYSNESRAVYASKLQ